MKLWKLSQEKNNGYDTYDSAVVAAESEDEARQVPVGDYRQYGTWAAPEFVTAELIGIAKEGTQAGEIICSSFNAG